jgi:DNA-binding transcriptional MerR regulator
MAYTVKEVAQMSGVSVRTPHFYHEAGLLAPAYVAANGYRFYEEPQLLTLQQILFYRELGFELKEIKRVLAHTDQGRLAALESHRVRLQETLGRTARLIETIDRTIEHLKGSSVMRNEELFAGFTVAAGEDRFAERINLRGEPSDCKVSARDTDGAMCIFEFNGAAGGPRHLHSTQDEWIYVLEGKVELAVGDRTFTAGEGESVFIPRATPHAWAAAEGLARVRILDVFQPAGTMEEFFRALGRYNDGPPVHEVLKVDGLRQLFATHGMELVGPPLRWNV